MIRIGLFVVWIEVVMIVWWVLFNFMLLVNRVLVFCSK